MTIIYKILRREEWAAAQRAGVFTGSGIDHRDGYIHFSTAAQAQETAQKHFAGQGDLVVLAVKADKLGPALKWEPSRGGALFPHLYGPLPVTQVNAVHEAPLDRKNIPTLAFLERN